MIGNAERRKKKDAIKKIDTKRRKGRDIERSLKSIDKVKFSLILYLLLHTF